MQGYPAPTPARRPGGHLELQDCTPGREVDYWPMNSKRPVPAKIDRATRSRVYVKFEVCMPGLSPMEVPALTKPNRLWPREGQQ